jgi:hypothetical protein
MRLTEKQLYQEYIVNGKTDREIAEQNGVSRTYICKLRTQYGIPTRETTGRIGEQKAVARLKQLGFDVMDMHYEDKLFPFDLLVNKFLRIEVKSSTVVDDNRFYFSFSDKPECDNKDSPFRITLPNGRSRKLYRKTCEILILVGMSEEYGDQYFIIPSDAIPDHVSGVKIHADPKKPRKFNIYHNAWDQLRW